MRIACQVHLTYSSLSVKIEREYSIRLSNSSTAITVKREDYVPCRRILAGKFITVNVSGRTAPNSDLVAVISCTLTVSFGGIPDLHNSFRILVQSLFVTAVFENLECCFSYIFFIGFLFLCLIICFISYITHLPLLL